MRLSCPESCYCQRNVNFPGCTRLSVDLLANEAAIGNLKEELVVVDMQIVQNRIATDAI